MSTRKSWLAATPALTLGRLGRPLLVSLALAAAAASPAIARDRHGSYPAVAVAPDLADAWILQLSPGSGVVPGYRRPPMDRSVRTIEGAVRERDVQGGEPRSGGRAPRRAATRPADGYTGSIAAGPGATVTPGTPGAPGTPGRAMKRVTVTDPTFLPQDVEYRTGEAPGTIVIDTAAKFLYRVEDGGRARRYGVGVGKPGFEWAGTHVVTRKQEWPTWTPPSQMREREKKKGRILPARMEGGVGNPLGARALYLGSTLYRIHGTNQPWSIGKAVSSGCIRMRNEDVTDLYEHVAVGTRVVVL